MKGLFPGYSHLSYQDKQTAWSQAIFVFDTNVLLNLYRYRENARKEWLNMLVNLSERVWIPYQVALEFQRNRLSVIAEQNQSFVSVPNTIEKAKSALFSEINKLNLAKRHAVIDPEPLISDLDRLINEFIGRLSPLEEQQQKLTEADPLQAQIEELFDNRVGKPPRDQKTIDALYREAEERFKLGIPPGFEDAKKDGAYNHDGITYKQKYGDYLVWQQLLDYAKENNKECIIFITDDGKVDWWQRINGKTIGPRPELTNEARHSAQIKTFLMYDPEGFLKYAQTVLEAPVSQETIEEVREVSDFNRSESISDTITESVIAPSVVVLRRLEKSLVKWLSDRFTIVEARRNSPSGIITLNAFRGAKANPLNGQNGQIDRFIATYVPRSGVRELQIVSFLRETIRHRRYRDVREVAAIFAVGSPRNAKEVSDIIEAQYWGKELDDLRVIIGVLRPSEPNERLFVPRYDFSIKHVDTPY